MVRLRDGYFSKVVTTDNKEFFFVTADAGAIETKQDEEFLVRFSNKHSAYFIVPVTNSSGFSKF